MLIPFSTGLWNICEAKLCFIKQQRDPHTSWVIPYTKEVRCTCTQFTYYACPVNFGNSLSRAKEYFYTDESSLFMKSGSRDKLRTLFECEEDAAPVGLSFVLKALV